MKVYFLNPPYFKHFGRDNRWQDTGRGGTLYYPIWLAYATGVTEEFHKARLIDTATNGWNKYEVIKDITNYNPDLIVIDTSFPSLTNDISVAEDIKKNYPHAKIVIVGPPTSQFPEIILKSPGVDIVARWEYDFTIKEIADALEEGKSLEHVRGISYKDNGKIFHNKNREWITSEELDTIPFVSKVYKKHLNIKDYFLGSSLYPEVQIFSGRGCPNSCIFCSWIQTFTGRVYRVRSIKNIIDELEYIQNNLREVKEVFFEDDTFTIDKKRVREFAFEYKRRDLNIVWACNARATLDYETMKEMRQANCRLLIVGYESGSDEMLKKMKKGITTKNIKEFAKSAKRANLLVQGDFIIGLPGESKKTIEETKKIIKEIKPEILQVSLATPFPGTEFYNICKNNKYLLTEDIDKYLDKYGHQKPIVFYPELSAQEISDEVDKILKEYYMSVGYIPLVLRQIFRKNGFEEARRIVKQIIPFIKYIRRFKR